MAQFPHIGTTTTLGWQNDELARSYMDHIVQRASVLLPRRGWRVGVIKEFYPRGASLLGLNVNAGREVCVRFRLPGKRSEFLPFHEVLCTALHEFTHCVHSRHDRAFWNLYYDLVKECEALEVAMIAQGKQLYPEAAYAPSQPSASAPRGKGRGATRGGMPSRGGHRLGGPQASTGRGGTTTTTRSRSGTVTITKRPGTPSTANPTSPAAPPRSASNISTGAVVFPGEGRRLGEGGNLRSFDITPGATPTRDALRQILAHAAERRQAHTRSTPNIPAAETGPQNSAGSSGPSAGQAADTTEEDDEEDVPDHIPCCQSAAESSDGSWKCTRCGFSNEASAHTCQLCTDDNDGGDDDGAPVALLFGNSETEKDSAPPSKTVRVESPGERSPNSSVPSLAVVVQPTSGATKEEAFEISDDDDA